MFGTLKRRMSGSLKIRFLIILIPAVIIGFVVSSFFVTHSSLKALTRAAERKIAGSGAFMGMNVSHWREFHENLLSSIAASPFVAKAISDPAARPDLNLNWKEMKSQFGFRNIALLDWKGVAIAGSNENRIGKEYSDMLFFQEALHQSGVVISKPRNSRVDGKPLVTFALKVASGKGVIFISIPLGEFYEQYVDITRNDPNSNAFILTREGKVLAHRALASGKPVELDLDKFLAETDGPVTFSEYGQTYLVYVHQDPKTGWYIVSATDKEEIQRAANVLVLTNCIVALAAIGLVSALILRLVQSVTRKIDTVVTAIKDLSSGDIELSGLDDQARTSLTRGQDELSVMGQAMDRLIQIQKGLVENVGAIASGDLSRGVIPAGPRDVLGNALAGMVDNLKVLIQAIESAATTLSDIIPVILSDGDNLARGASEQSDAIASIGDAIHRIEDQTRQTAQASSSVNDRAATALHVAEDGKQQMRELVRALEAISVSGKDISATMQDITNIADQTNLIALNATIEAARARELGRGFAVVAQEVKTLAASSANAAQKSNALFKVSLEKIAEGNQVLNLTEKSLLSIVQHFNATSDELTLIVGATRDQAQSTAQLVRGVTQIEGVTKDNVRIAEQVAQHCHQLASLSSKFDKACSKFSL
ncbi:MAG: methyl-accepting chemotaxis protein [Desulfobacter sp.]|nr:MAG: methyl-accepting chemotaxis protein [Desulfobacter sp.]